MDAPVAKKTFTNDASRIQYHLIEVIRVLRTKEFESHTTAYTNRIKLLDALEAYTHRKVFPSNHYHSVRTPYFIDNYDVHCAVGYLMQYSGYESLARQIQREHNYDYLADIHTPGISKWADDHGFSIDELKWIQPAYNPESILKTLGTGSNAPIHNMDYNPATKQLLITGQFNEINDKACHQVAVYKAGDFTCSGGGLVGTVKSAKWYNNEIVAVGDFMDNNVNYPLAILTQGNWKYYQIPDRTTAVSHEVFVNPALNQLEIVTSRSSMPGVNEVWLLDRATEKWSNKAWVNGKINVIYDCYYGRFYGGQFDSIHVNIPNKKTFASRNLAQYQTQGGEHWTSANSLDVSENVLKLKMIDNKLVVAGECSLVQGIGTPCLSIYDGLVYREYLNREHFTSFKDSGVNWISDIEVAPRGEIILVGNFTNQIFGLGVSGLGAALYDTSRKELTAIADFDKPANSVVITEDGLIIGGDFRKNTDEKHSTIDLQHIAVTTVFTSVEELDKDATLLYPNPVSNELSLMGYENIHLMYNVVDISGKRILAGNTHNGIISGLDQLVPGQYVLNVIMKSGEANYRFVKE